MATKTRDKHFPCGATVWTIPDGYYPEHSSGVFPSHEAVCLLNTGSRDARVSLTLYFEDREPLVDFNLVCPARRTLHARMDQLTNAHGATVPKGVPYAVLVRSSQPIVVQYSRMDTTQAALALMTTMAYPIARRR